MVFSPEVVAHQRYRNPVDVWALGVVGLEYLEGLPDEGSTTEAEYARLVSAHAQRLAQGQPGNRHRLLLSRMLRMKAEERPTAEGCLEVLGGMVADTVEPRATAAAVAAQLGVVDSQGTVRGPGSSSRAEDLDSAELEAYIALGNGSSVAPPRTAVRRAPSEETDGHEASSSGDGGGDDDDDDRSPVWGAATIDRAKTGRSLRLGVLGPGPARV
ncbi:hypothetical protein C8A05DRAFT_37362 [Staphylotrichum tortipilum]|uniref:Protein kinase domain-containing protein n=1 Tax=Staphylotrichum tortipilum TaxID=2831512 RepID=A0AAN6MDT9_9PEZI|nr:hypothetical protein C8A05DRAFT_37362 [Staphylotrichum longicolle]